MVLTPILEQFAVFILFLCHAILKTGKPRFTIFFISRSNLAFIQRIRLRNSNYFGNFECFQFIYFGTTLKPELEKGSHSFPHNLQQISYKRFLECIQWRLSIYPLCTQVAEGTFFIKSPVDNENKQMRSIYDLDIL